jgi:16S rRNA (guanine966-N2)-methyltransferase
MRIISGDKKGTILQAPTGEATRPTLGRIRESVFGTLSQIIPDAHIVDLFAGSGSLGLEALSRGAVHCTFVENSPAALTALRANIEKLRYGNVSTIITSDAVQACTTINFAGQTPVIFCDPPYGRGLAQSSLIALEQNSTLPVGSVVMIQCGSRDELRPGEGSVLQLFRTKTYRETAVYYFEAHPVPGED